MANWFKSSIVNKKRHSTTKQTSYTTSTKKSQFFKALLLLILPVFLLSNTLFSVNASSSTIIYKGDSIEYNGSGTTFTLPTPSEKTVGDVFIAQIVATGGSATTITAPAGWTLIREDNNGTSVTSALYSHIVSTTEPSSYTWNFKATSAISGGIADFSGVNTSTPINVTDYATGSGVSINASSVMTTVPNAMVLFFGATNKSSSITAPSAMTGTWNVSSNSSTSYMADVLQSAQGATGNKTATITNGTNASTVSEIIALTPQTISPTATPTPIVQPTPTLTPTSLPTATPTPTSIPTPTLTPPTVFSTSQWDTDIQNAVNADNTQSVTLPNGNILWAFGDTTQVNGVSTVGAYGYPHDSFVVQSPGTQNFSPVPGSYGYGWQQVPNWSDGSFFWMSTPLIDNGTLYIIGERVSQSGSTFTVIGNYAAEFNPNTLAYESIVALPNGATGTTIWGGAAKGTNGWWITGTHGVSCSDATDCKVGDLAFVPFGDIANSSAWTITNNFVPATDNADTTLALIQTATGWDIFTKLGGSYGGTQIERLTSTSIYGPWTVNGTWSAPSPSGTVTYNVAVHPEQASPSGQILTSYNVNGVSSDYHPLFEYLPE